ncbi:putative Heterokaryon incompatibility domain-containing protein [Seiridium cardinale]|uniref:Heterokaryon incompatibility domain-containing protein n=1 Tax=Seiridium cardinale TaxID=138064 RepID=A0ABR2Y055_9PEZI
MRLLQLRPDNELVLTDNLIHDIPPYAILSHTWGSDGDEVTFQDLMEGKGKDKSGYGKIIFCHQFHLQLVPERANIYVYLAGVSKEDAIAQDGEFSHLNWKSAFRESRWFNRVWTLQELLAPSKVEFFSATKQRLGDKKLLEQTIHKTTRIPLRALQGYALSEFTIDERISWSNSRRTKRPEDKAYSLLGILGVYMSLIYGEGEENAFTRIRVTINQTHETNTGLGNASDKSKALHYYIPFPKNRRFTGRDGILVDIQKRLFGVESCQKLAVVGLGGMGKTQLALQLAYWVKERRPEYSVLWIPALSLESFEQTTTEIAKRLGVKKETNDEDIKTSLLRHLELEYDRKWFLVVDNADDMDILYGSTALGGEGIYQYLPITDNCIILFTTRLREVALSVAETDVTELGEMSAEEATNFFAKATIHTTIAQAVAYLNRNRLSIKRYLELLRSTGKEMVSLMSTEFRDNTRYRGSQNAIATTWLVSFDQIREKDSIAGDILLFISLIEPRAIPRQLLPQAKTEAEMAQALGTLCGSEHTLAQAYLKNKQIRKAISILEHVVDIRTQTQDEEDIDRLYSEHELAEAYLEDGQIQKAISMLENVVDVELRILDKEDTNQLTSQCELGRAYLEHGQTTKAIGILESVARIEAQVLAEDDEDRLMTLDLLNEAYGDLEQLSQPMVEPEIS